MAETKAIGKLDEPMVHACGKAFGWIQSYQKHARSCNGKPVETRGRIDRLARRPAAKRTVSVDRTPPAVKRVASMPRKTKSKRAGLPARKARRAAPRGKPTGDGRYDAVLEDLRAKRDRIAAAIEQLEALA